MLLHRRISKRNQVNPLYCILESVSDSSPRCLLVLFSLSAYIYIIFFSQSTEYSVIKVNVFMLEAIYKVLNIFVDIRVKSGRWLRKHVVVFVIEVFTIHEHVDGE